MKKFLAIVLAVLMTASLGVVGMAASVPVKRIQFNNYTIWLHVGSNRTVLPETVPSNAAMPELEWTSSDESVATVDSTGKVTGLSAGNTTITATTTDGEFGDSYALYVRNAEDTPAMVIGNTTPGQTLEYSVSINYQTSNQVLGFDYVSFSDIRTLSFKNNQMIAEERNGRIRIRPTVPRYEPTDVGTSITDVLTVTLADDTTHEFSVKINITNRPQMEFVKIEGHPGRDLHSKIPLGDTYPYIFELVDKANLINEILAVEVWIDEEPYNPELPPIVDVGEKVINGKQIVVPLTPARNGDAYITVSVDYRTSTSIYYSDRESFSWHMDIGPDEANSGNNSGGDDKTEPSATDNIINTEETLQAIAYGDELLELKVSNYSAGIALTTMDTMGNYHTTVSVQNGDMRVEIPGGFGKVNEPGRIYYPMDYIENLANADDLAAAVKGENAKTEVVKAGGDMVMPTTVTVTLKTKLTGTVNVYYYNEETRRFTLLASPVAKDGKITFTTKQMGHMVLTTGTI